MITTLRVLGVRSWTRKPLDAAISAVVDYLASGVPEALTAYYGGHCAHGQARGSAASLLGMDHSVSADALARLLGGRHGLTGRPLLSAVGSAGRAHPRRGPVPDREWLSLAEAASAAGVGPDYLRRLARAGGEPRADGEVDQARPSLAAEKDASGDWRVRREELLRVLTARQPPAVVIGHDVTCAAPKSVSLLWAFGDEALRRDILAALDAGVDAVIGYLEATAAFGQVEASTRSAVGFGVASYLHEESRTGDPHLHVHNLVINALPIPVTTDEGRDALAWRAVDGELMCARVMTAGYLGAATLRHELSRRRGLRWGEVRNGVAELAAFPPDLLDAFSRRRGQIEDALIQLDLPDDGAGRAAAQRRTRPPKTHRAADQIQADWREALTEAGWTESQVARLAAPSGRRPTPPGEEEIAALTDQLVGPHGLTERTSHFGEQDVIRAVASWARDRLTPEQILTVSNRILADERLVVLDMAAGRRRHQPEPRYTTVGLLDSEQRLLTLTASATQSAATTEPSTTTEPVAVPAPVPPAAAAIPDGTGARPEEDRRPAGPLMSPARLEELLATRRARRLTRRLADEQIALVRRLITGSDPVRPAIGPAGTGKTEAMRLLTHLLTADGRTVVGTAHGGRQAEELGGRLGIDSQVVASWLTRLNHADDPADVLPPGTVMIVDEATQVATRDAARLLRYTSGTGTVLILLGDPAQLGAVGASGWFLHLTSGRPDTPRLTIPHRQAAPTLGRVRAALAGLRSTDPGPLARSLDALAADGRLRVFGDRDELLAAVVTDWYADYRAHRPPPATEPSEASAGPAGPAEGWTRERLLGLPRMMAERHGDVDRLAAAARTLLLADGTITGPILHVAGRAFQAGDQVITLSQAGHTLIPAGQARHRYLRTGTLGIVTAVHLHPDRERQSLTVHVPGRGDVHVDWGYLTHRFPDGRAGALAHAYALTAHAAQGTSMTTARAVAPATTSRPGLYVMLSRAQTDLAAYVIHQDTWAFDPEDDSQDWLPVLPRPHGPATALAGSLARSEPDRMAHDLDPAARAAHQARARHDLAALTTASHRPPQADPAEPGHALTPAVAAAAARAAETAIRAAALADPPPRLLARIGPRPAAGPDRVLWDQAVGDLAVYHARWQPTAPADHPGPPPPGTLGRESAERWKRQRTAAAQLAHQWATHLPPPVRARFHSTAEQIPRTRAIAGLHALLDHGHTIPDLLSSLQDGNPRAIRSGAAVLDHRVAAVCDATGIDPAPYTATAPRTALEDWLALQRLLDGATIAALARTPTAALAAERQRLRPPGQPASGHGPERPPSSPSGPDRAPTVERRRLIDAALDRQINTACHHAALAPTRYLTDLLGPRPDSETPTDWDQRARQIEDHRHRHLGLPYGQPADPASTSPLRRAFGDQPPDPPDVTILDAPTAPAAPAL